MKRSLMIILCLCALLSVQAQNISNGSKWWSGSDLYTATVRAGGVVYFQGSDYNELTIEKVGDKAGTYKIIPSRQAEDRPPLRGEFGWRVQHIRQEGMNFLVVRRPNGDASEILVLTPDNLKNCQGQEEWAEKQPVSDIITGMLLNTTYLSRFSKDELRLMRNEILARHGWKFQSKDLQEYFGKQSWYKPVADNKTIKLNIIEQTNVQMIKSEELVPDSERGYMDMSDPVYNQDLRGLVQGQGLFPGGLDDDGRGPDEIDGEDYYSVTNETEFLAALGSNRTVVIAAGAHLNLSRVLEREEMFVGQRGRRWTGDATAIVSKEPLVVSESETDGRQLALVNMKNLIIKGEQNSSIEVDPRYSYCLYFINCENCEVHNLTIGHTEGGYCSGGVIGVRGGRMTLVKDCDLYGCGTYGLDLIETSDFALMNSNIHDCTYGIMELRSCVSVKFTKCDFFSNREYSLIEGWGVEGLVFDDCRFFANWGDAPLFNLDNTFYLMGCQVYHPSEHLGSMKMCEQIGNKTVFIDNPLDPNIKGRGIGPR